MENNCKYVCSRGLLKSCSFHSKNPQSSNRNDLKYLIDRVSQNNMFDGMSIYVCSDLLYFFVNNILLKLNNKFYLITGDSDMTIPNNALTNESYIKLINNNYLIKWFAQNSIIQNEKIIQMPIGMDYHTISNNKNHIWKSINEGYSPLDQETILLSLKENANLFNLREIKVYCNFSSNNDRFNDRKKALNVIKDNELFVYENNFIKRTNNWKNICKYAFAISPHGQGLDCHRTWEILCLGSIPIVRCEVFPAEKLYEDLPILIVKEWSDITIELLEKTINEFKEKKFNYDKLNLNYWTNQFT
jgi:hypothetical protein